MALLAVAALSARLLAEAAARDGHAVIALDAFGDRDTLRASRAWHPAGAPGRIALDAGRVLDGLRRAAQEGAAGWIAGSGFEADLELLEAAAAVLPLFGTPPAAQRMLRDARTFFARLDDLGIAHPETRFKAPADGEGWLSKDFAGQGGWQVRQAGRRRAQPTRPSMHWQRESRGVPLSATFVADGRGAHRLGCNRLLVQRRGAHPYTYRGAIGPLRLMAAAERQVDEALKALVPAFGLVGLASLDCMLEDDGTLQVLEVNARPSASMALYDGPLVEAHLAACRGEAAPPWPAPAGGVVGHEVVCAARALDVDERLSDALGALGWCHDLPRPGMRLAPGDPLCSHSCRAADAAAVQRQLARQHEHLLRLQDP